MIESNDLIVFYDGNCGFCNRSVHFILKHDKTKRIRFASIQSNFCTTLFLSKGFEMPDLSTFYFLENGVLYTRSKAAIQVARYFSFPYRMISWVRIIPTRLRDFAYNWIASRRQRISAGYCVIPNAEEVQRFIK